MVINITFTEDMKYKKCTVTEKRDGRLFCRVPFAYELDEFGNKTRYVYKEIYGVDGNDIALKRAIFIEEQITATLTKKATNESFVAQMNDWLYGEKYGTVKPTSFDRLEGILVYQIIPAVSTLTHHRLADIDGKDIKAIMKFNLDKGYSYSTLLKIYRFLSEFFNYHVNGGTLERNPVRQVKMYQKSYVQNKQAEIRNKREKLKERADNHEQLTKEEMRFLDDDEIERLKAAAVKTFGNGKPCLKQAEFFIFMLNTGLRAGEALALKYSDFDYANRTVLISKNITSTKARGSDGRATGKRAVISGETKTKRSTALLSINQTAVDIIKRLQAQEPDGYNGYIIHNGDLTIEPQALEKRFYNLLRLAQIEKTSLHTLRHTCASKLYELTNGDTQFVSEMLRHESASFTAKTYIHLERKYKSKRMNHFAI